MSVPKIPVFLRFSDLGNRSFLSSSCCKVLAEWALAADVLGVRPVQPALQLIVQVEPLRQIQHADHTPNVLYVLSQMSRRSPLPLAEIDCFCRVRPPVRSFVPS